MESVVLGFGSNLGARAALIDGAQALLAGQPGLQIVRVSALYETPPLGPPQPDYLNAAALVTYAGSAESLLDVTQFVETLLLRTRDVRWGARTLDIDLLASARGAQRTARLSLPHPGLFERGFALAPLRDVAPPWPIASDATGPEPLLPARVAHPVRVVRRAGAVLVAANDLAEWLSASVAEAVEIAWPCVAGPQRVPPSAAAAMAFRISFRDEQRALSVVLARLTELFEAGFAVRCAVVTASTPRSAAGLFLGQHTGHSMRLPALRIRAGEPGEVAAARYHAQLSLA